MNVTNADLPGSPINHGLSFRRYWYARVLAQTATVYVFAPTALGLAVGLQLAPLGGAAAIGSAAT